MSAFVQDAFDFLSQKTNIKGFDAARDLQHFTSTDKLGATRTLMVLNMLKGNPTGCIMLSVHDRGTVLDIIYTPGAEESERLRSTFRGNLAEGALDMNPHMMLQLMRQQTFTPHNPLAAWLKAQKQG